MKRGERGGGRRRRRLLSFLLFARAKSQSSTPRDRTVPRRVSMTFSLKSRDEIALNRMAGRKKFERREEEQRRRGRWTGVAAADDRCRLSDLKRRRRWEIARGGPPTRALRSRVHDFSSDSGRRDPRREFGPRREAPTLPRSSSSSRRGKSEATISLDRSAAAVKKAAAAAVDRARLSSLRPARSLSLTNAARGLAAFDHPGRT